MLRPTASQLGWESGDQELPDRQELRRAIIAALGTLNDQEILAGARQRFAAFVANHSAVKPDDQMMVLTIVARHADAATFEQLHTLAKTAKTETEMRRCYFALMTTEDPALAAQAASIAMSTEIPPQAAVLRLFMVLTLAEDHPQLAWEVLSAHVDELIAPQGRYAPVTLARSVPAALWDALPPEDLENWLTAHVPPGLSANVTRAMETVAFRRSEKASLAAAVAAYLQALPAAPGG